jgi:N-acetylmuramoyl-L-alanine amidase
MMSLLIIFQSTAFAAQSLNLSYDGKTVKYSGTVYKVNINSNEIKTDFPAIVFNKATVIPVRAVFEELGGNAAWNAKTQIMDVTYNSSKIQFKNNTSKVSINGKAAVMSTPAKLINGRLVIPAAFLKQLQGLNISVDDKSGSINIISKTAVTTGQKQPLQNPANGVQTLTLNYDGKTVKYTGNVYGINIDSKEIKSDFPAIVFNNVAMFPVRAVFEQLGGNVTWNAKTQVMDVTYNGAKIQFKNNDSKAIVNGKTVRMDAPAKKINERLIIPAAFLNQFQELNMSVDDKSRVIYIVTKSSINDVLTETTGNKDIITIKVSNFKGCQASRLTEPNRIVVDLKNVTALQESKKIQSALTFVTGITITASSTNSARVELELKDMENFSLETLKDGCKIVIQKPVNAKLSYVNKYDRVYFILKDVKLASVGSTIKNYFEESYDTQNSTYSIILPASLPVSLAEDTINIDDALLSTVQIYRDKQTNNTNIVFHMNKQYKFYTTYNDKLGQTEINLLTPAKDGERLVVIDAGHGGKDSGATGNSIYEKDINLAIALKLEKLLKEKNVKTFMLRQDDTFVGLYDRPYIANVLNASLFLSIHNNAIDSTSTSGTETLYSPDNCTAASFTGKKFAQLIQDSLIKNINSVNRKTVSRPGLVVLKYTKMPSALAEIGFVTNASEAKKLKDDSYQQKVAQALCDAIMASLNQLGDDKTASSQINNEDKKAAADSETENIESVNAEGDIKVD